MAKKIPQVRLGIDLGGTKIHALIIDAKGKVLGSAKIATKAERGYQAVVERIAKATAAAIEEAGIKRKAIKAIGLGAPGPLDPKRGIVHFAPNLGWTDKPLACDAGKKLGIPVVLGNDVNFGGLGEVSYGAARGHASAVAAFIGTGLGGAVIVGDRVLNGAHGYAGEIGHLPAPFGEAVCGCGRRGCLETVASKTGIVRAVAEAVSRGQKAKLLVDGTVKSSDIVLALQAGCPVTRRAVDDMIKALAWGLATVGNSIDPEVFIIGGGMAEALGKSILTPLAQHMAEHAVLYRRNKPRLVLAKLGDDAVAVGAAVASVL